MVGEHKKTNERTPTGSYGEVFHVAWPIVLSMLSYTFMGLADTVIVSRLGMVAVAAVGLATTAYFTVTSFGWGLLDAVKVVVSQSWGAGDTARTKQAARQGLAIAFGCALALMALYPMSSIVLGWMGGTGSVLSMGTDYLEIRFFGVIPAFISVAAFGYFQGLGLTKIPMVITIVANVLNVILDIILVFGFGPIPAFGVKGAAIATVIAFGVQGLLAVAVLWRHTGGLRPLERKGCGEIFRHGIPMGLRFALEIGSWGVFTALVARAGEAHLAAHVIAIRIISVSFLPGHGIGQAACILTGQAVGARRPDIAQQVVKKANNIAISTMGLCGVLFLLCGAWLVGLFKPETSVLNLGANLLLIAAAFQVFDAIAMVTMGALNGSGDTKYVMIVGVLTSWLTLVPLGLLFCNGLGWGAPGAWVALLLHIVLVAGIVRKRWLRDAPARVVAKLSRATG